MKKNRHYRVYTCLKCGHSVEKDSRWYDGRTCEICGGTIIRKELVNE